MRAPRPFRRSLRRVLSNTAVALGAGLVLTPLLTGCGASAGEVSPTGIDGLTIPTPVPTAADFVATVDNAWLPLTPGARWVYRAVAGTEPKTEITVEVLAEPGSAGTVATTRVRTEQPGVKGSDTRLDEFAQDRAGNVWWLAREGQWAVGEESGEGTVPAGLAWPAQPRIGDGWYAALVPGGPEDLVRVVDEVATLTGPTGEYTALVVSEHGSTGQSMSHTRVWWARGTGPVRLQTPTGEVLDLVEHTRP